MSLLQPYKELRSGLTTGTCSAAVAKAAAYMLVHQKVIDYVEVTLPGGEKVRLDLINCKISEDQARCSTLKDAGDDPDITNGTEIVGKCSWNSQLGINIIGGKGIGIVTKPGLAVEVGLPAINPVPLQMIREAVSEVVGDKGVDVEISIPAGDELARRTFNPRLGIVGGLSILGTTGIVKPMSEEALKDSLVIKLRQMASIGCSQAVFAPGNYAQNYLNEQLQLDADKVVLTSNFMGYMLELAVRYLFKKILIIGHLGKLVKLAGGIFQTHSRIADARNEILAAHYFSFSKDAEAFKQIMESNTTEEVVEIIPLNNGFWTYLVDKIKIRAEQYVHGDLQIEVVLLSQKSGLLAMTKDSETILNDLAND